MDTKAKAPEVKAGGLGNTGTPVLHSDDQPYKHNILAITKLEDILKPNSNIQEFVVDGRTYTAFYRGNQGPRQFWYSIFDPEGYAAGSVILDAVSRYTDEADNSLDATLIVFTREKGEDGQEEIVNRSEYSLGYFDNEADALHEACNDLDIHIRRHKEGWPVEGSSEVMYAPPRDKSNGDGAFGKMLVEIGERKYEVSYEGNYYWAIWSSEWPLMGTSGGRKRLVGQVDYVFSTFANALLHIKSSTGKWYEDVDLGEYSSWEDLLIEACREVDTTLAREGGMSLESSGNEVKAYSNPKPKSPIGPSSVDTESFTVDGVDYIVMNNPLPRESSYEYRIYVKDKQNIDPRPVAKVKVYIVYDDEKDKDSYVLDFDFYYRSMHSKEMIWDAIGTENRSMGYFPYSTEGLREGIEEALHSVSILRQREMEAQEVEAAIEVEKSFIKEINGREYRLVKGKDKKGLEGMSYYLVYFKDDKGSSFVGEIYILSVDGHVYQNETQVIVFTKDGEKHRSRIGQFASEEDALDESIHEIDIMLNRDESNLTAEVLPSMDQSEGTPEGWKPADKTGMDTETGEKNPDLYNKDRMLIERDPKRVKKDKVKTTHYDKSLEVHRDFLDRGYEHGGDPKEYPVGQEGWWSQSTKDFYWAPNEPSVSFSATIQADRSKKEEWNLAKSQDGGDRTYVARNTKDPEVLTYLANDKVRGVVREVIRNGNTPDSVMESLAKKFKNDTALGVDIAQSTESSKVFSILSTTNDPEVKRAVIIICEDPKILKDLLDSGDIEVAKSMADKSFRRSSSAEALKPILESLLANKNKGVHVALADNSYLPEWAYRELYKKNSVEVNRSLADTSSVPADIRNALALSSDATTRNRAVYHYRQLTGDTVNKRLAMGDAPLSRDELHQLPQVEQASTEALEKLTYLMFKEKYLEGVKYVAWNDNADAKLLTKIYKNNPEKWAEHVATNRNTPTEILHEIMLKNYGRSRVSVAENPSTSKADLHYLAKLTEWKILVAVAGNPSTAPETFELLIKQGSSDGLLRKDIITQILHNPSAPADMKNRFRTEVLKREGTPVEDTSPDVNKPYPKNVRSGEELYKALLMRQELLYKYRALKEQYGGKTPPPESKLPVFEFETRRIQDVCIDYIHKIIYNWRAARLGDRERRIKEMEQNEAILEKLKAAKGGSVDVQAEAIELGLNTIHSSGPMIEHLGMSKIMLDHLSNMDTSKWDKQLEFMASAEKVLTIQA